ncbi:MAG TPA: hypothetical protein DGT23_01665 [Micromonosporaceae bacterium]|nr:hypothetical protein [Micromonosporaceae bacterium]
MRGVASEIGQWLNERGYSGRSPRFWMQGRAGDWGAVELQTSTSLVIGEDKFFLNVGYTPALWWSWRSRDLKGEYPGPETGLVWDRIADPTRRIPDSAWVVPKTPDGSANTARILRDVLGDTLSRYEQLLDPHTAWRHAIDEDFRAMIASWSLMRACLLAAEGRTPQLRTALDEIVARRAAHRPFADWIWDEVG